VMAFAGVGLLIAKIIMNRNATEQVSTYKYWDCEIL
jgi:hypothetical protein